MCIHTLKEEEEEKKKKYCERVIPKDDASGRERSLSRDFPRYARARAPDILRALAQSRRI